MSTAAGSSFYDDAEALDAYLTHRHAEVRSPNLVMEDPAFRNELGDLTGLDVVDLGCGDGTFAAQCVRAGCASYTGVDASQGMIERARIAAPTASFQQSTMERVALGQSVYDLVVARMALHYVVDLDEVFVEAKSGLRPGGRIIFSVVHPILTAALEVDDGPRTSVTVDNYFELGDRHRSWFGSQVVWQHRTVEQYVSALLAAGFELTGLRECPPVEALFDGDDAEFERRRRAPVFLLVSARAPG